MENRIIIRDLVKKFKIGFRKNQGTLFRILDFFSGRESKKNLFALKGVSLNVKKGEILGIIGENGGGKSTLLRCIAGIYRQDKGIVKKNGKMISLINLNIGMQDRLTMKDNIFLVGALFDISRKDIKKRFNSIVEFSELKDYVNTKLYQFSNGMLQRLAFSIAIHSNPEILLLDEVFEVGDEEFKKKSAEKIKELVSKGASVVLVSHELWMIEKYCHRVIWIDEGRIKMEGDVKSVLKGYEKKGN